MIEIRETPLDVAEVTQAVTTPTAGGIDVFVGTVRNETRGKKVVRLEFEAYEKMALSEMEKILIRAREKWPIEKCAIVHRVGTLLPPDIAVVIAVSTPHRVASFEACRFIIDTLKETVPIWKKEIFEDGAEWVSAHP
ncbi:MAG: molybdenum cofactor biosynthesis protein MoaE [Cyclobacteriaceae bacterium]|nr:molybdenum cofactor biosynthesis protein MoaE [Cyclobacteriaceae bacterium]